MISTSNKRKQYSGNGSTVAFAYDFRILNEDDLLVVVQNSSGTDSIQTITTNYTVNGVGNPGGGTVTMVTAPASGETLSLIQNAPPTQLTDYATGDGFPAEAHEDALDNVVNAVKRARDLSERALTLKDGSVAGTGDYDAGSNKITNLTAGVANTDAATISNVNAAVAAAILDEAGSNLISTLGSGYVLQDTNYQIADTGSTARLLTDRLSEMSSVMDFGATGDGVTDDTAALQAAVDAGGWIFFPPGTYLTDQVNVTGEVHLVLDPSAIVKQRSAADQDIALIRFTTGADNSTLEGGQFDGNAGTLAASYTGSTETNKRVWTAIRVEGAIDYVNVRRVRIYDFMMSGFWHQNGQNCTWEDIHVARCGKGFICQSNDFGALRRIVCEEIQNRNKAIYQHAVEIRDATGLVIEGIMIADFKPDGTGVEPTPTAIAFERMDAMEARGLIASGFSGTGNPGMGFVFDTLLHSSVVGWSVRGGYEQGATVNSCSESELSSFTMSFDRLTALGGDGIGLRLRPGGLYPAISAGAVAENARANDGCRNLRISNGSIVGAGAIGYMIQTGEIVLSGCEAIGCVTHGFHINENLANTLFAGATAPRAENVRLDSCSARYCGQTGVLIEDGRLISIEGGNFSNNGQNSSAATNARSGIRITSGADVRIMDAVIEDTQDWSTKTDGASFEPGSTTSDRYSIELVDPDQINIGQTITLVDAGGAGTSATAVVVDKQRDTATVEVSGGFTFSSSGNLTSLTGLFTTSTYVLTGSGSALNTEVPGRTFVTDGTNYRRIIRVNSATAGVVEDFPSDLSGAALQALTVNVTPVASQQYGVRVESGVTGVTGDAVVGNGNVSALWSVASASSLSRVGSSGNERPDIASAGTVTIGHDVHYAHITGTTNINTVIASYAGKVLVLEFAAVLTVNDGTGNLVLNGNFTTSDGDTLTLICDGTNWVEISRSAN